MTFNPIDTSQVQNLLKEILHSPALVKKELLAQRGWAAVPVEQFGYISRRELERLLQALCHLGLKSFLVIYPSDPDVEAHGEQLLVGEASLKKAANVRSFNYVITTKNLDFVYHKTNEDFNLVAGPRKFVEIAIGASVEAGLWDWGQFCDHPASEKSERDVYMEIAEWYRCPTEK